MAIVSISLGLSLNLSIVDGCFLSDHLRSSLTDFIRLPLQELDDLRETCDPFFINHECLMISLSHIDCNKALRISLATSKQALADSCWVAKHLLDSGELDVGVGICDKFRHGMLRQMPDKYISQTVNHVLKGACLAGLWSEGLFKNGERLSKLALSQGFDGLPNLVESL